MSENNAFLLPTGPGEGELVEKKSRFIGNIFKVESEEEALAHIKELKDKTWDANHHVYAYILDGGTMRYSDDGEPGGTAGMPVLEVLRHAGLRQVLCVVTRYFGGTLLGTGGLVRAYGKTAGLALDAAGISRRCRWSSLEIPCPYPLYDRVSACLREKGAQIADTVYGSDVTLKLLIPEEEEEALRLALTDLTAGKLEIQSLGTELRDFPV